MRDAGGEPLVLPDGRDAWSIRELATRAVSAERPTAAVVRADVAIPIGALPALVERCEALAAERGLAVHLFGHAGIGILHALVLADEGERPAADAARDALVAHCAGARRLVLGRARDGPREPRVGGAGARGGAIAHAGREGALRPARHSQSGQDVVKGGACGSSSA
jgi:hypothetical protein